MFVAWEEPFVFQFGLFYSFEVYASKHIKSILIIIMGLCPHIDLKSINIIGGRGEKSKINKSSQILCIFKNETWRKMRLWINALENM